MSLFYLLNEFFYLSYQISGVIAIESSIISNFILNSYWTWRDRKTSDSKEKKIRFFKYHLATGFSALVNYGILISLIEVLALNKYFSNLVGIAVAGCINFGLNHFWTFRKRA
jgi:dolichol-phosphate mannosyltransferase